MIPLNYLKHLLLILITFSLSFVILYLYFSFNPSTENIFPKCLIKKYFGIYCTGCGGQRAFHYLLHLNFNEAIKFNAFITIFSPLLIIIIINSLYNFIFIKKIELTFMTNKFFISFILLFILIFTIIRNIPYYPFTLLIP